MGGGDFCRCPFSALLDTGQSAAPAQAMRAHFRAAD
jgi:hypothetical protein